MKQEALQTQVAFDEGGQGHKTQVVFDDGQEILERCQTKNDGQGFPQVLPMDLELLTLMLLSYHQ